MAEMKKRFPEDMDYVVALDTTRAVTEGMKEIVKTLVIAIVLVIIVVYIFLQGWRATLIPLLAVPVSLVGTFVFFPLFGFSINTLSLFGLVLAIGLVVDDAIVVVEAVERHIEEGMTPKAAALKAMEETLRPGGRHRAGSVGGVRADGVHPGHHRPALSAVCRDHRDLRDPLGLQRAHAEPGAGGAAAAAEGSRVTGCWGDSSTGSTASFERATEGYVRWCAALIRKSVVVVVLLAGIWRGGWLFRAAECPPASCRTKIRATCTCTCNSRMRRRCERTDAAAARGGRDPDGHAGSAIHHHAWSASVC